MIEYSWRGDFTSAELNALHAEGFGHRVLDDDWLAQVTRLVAIAAEEAKAAGCEWLHVDFEDHLRRVYFDSCGFTPTNAGLIALV